MPVGLSVYDTSAAELLELAVAADEAGFDALWLGEHVVLPVDYTTEHPTDGEHEHAHITGPIVHPETELVDPLVVLAAVAGATTHLRVATGIYLLPLRHPLLTARAAVTLQEASSGRFLLGVGAGWLEEEFAAIGVPFGERRSRLDEAIDVLRAAWAGGPFEHHGPHFCFGRVQVSRRPVDVPLVLGGNGLAARRRAASIGDGWFASGTPDFDDAVGMVAELRGHRPEPEFRCYVRVADAEPATIARYVDAGLHDVVVWADQLWPPTGTVDEKRAAFLAAAARLGLGSP